MKKVLITFNRSVLGGGHHVLRLFLKYFLKKRYKVILANTDNSRMALKRISSLVQSIQPYIIVRVSGPYIPSKIARYTNSNHIVINYVHFPFEGTLKGFESPPALEARFIDVARILGFKAERCKDNLDDTLILTNSYYTRVILRKTLNVDNVFVVYPSFLEERITPIDYEDFIQKFSYCRIASLGTYTLGKRYHYVPFLACLLKDCLFFVAGYASQRYQKMYLNFLKSLSKFLNRNNLIFLTNVNEDLKKEILIKALIFLHLRFFEHFGIAILEAIKYGALPIIHYSGGMIELCKYSGFCEFFHSYRFPILLKEIERLIEKVRYSDKSKIYSRYLRALHVINKKFTFKNFEKTMDDILGRFT